jgi:DNA-binding response OmpR family regulator
MKKILMVDDDRGFQKIVRLGCERSGIPIEICEPYNFYIDKVKDHSYAAIILDLRMVPMNGLDMAKEIRKVDIDTQIYILSNYDEDYVLDEARNKHVDLDGFISKNESVVDSIKELVYA